MIKMSRKLDMLMKELKKTNSETFFHSLRTKKYTCALINVLNSESITNYTPEEIDIICKGAMLHDVGKLNVHNYILTKAEILTDEEKKDICKHAQWSYELVKDELEENEFDIVCDICKYHHERIDGSGYNSKTDLPLYVQIVSLCDVFDALNSDRVYRKALSAEKAYSIIRDGKNGKFDDLLIDKLQVAMEGLL